MNPVLPENCFVPDSEARVMPDGRLYVYGSWDVSGTMDFCSRELHCFSTDDLEHWVDHGLIFRNDAVWTGIPWVPNGVLFAPDAIYRDGKYYLYLCGPDDKKGYEGVAVADSPVGPFAPAEPVEPANGDGIDPTVFVDDDGQAYFFWGQFSLRGGKLEADMKTLVPDSIEGAILTEWEHGFHEGASIRKRNGKYYLVYTDISRGRATCLSYAMADKPLGPYKKCGVIVDNVYCDPESWNNHGSIACFRGKWYVFYHRSSQKTMACRRLCIEPIEFDENGLIHEVPQTSQGVSVPLNAFEPIRASAACRVFGSYIVPGEDRELLTGCGTGQWGMPGWAEYKYLDFGDGAGSAVVRLRGKGKLLLRAENNCLLGSGEFDHEDFQELMIPIQPVSGVHALWLAFEGSGIDVDSFVFLK